MKQNLYEVAYFTDPVQWGCFEVQWQEEGSFYLVLFFISVQLKQDEPVSPEESVKAGARLGLLSEQCLCKGLGEFKRECEMGVTLLVAWTARAARDMGRGGA